MPKIRLCALSDIDENQSKGFSPEGEPLQQLFIVRRDGQYFAYLNQCPHTGATLNWQDHQFLDIDNQYIQCAVHGALFRVHDGYCLRGPCANQRLSSVSIEILDNDIYWLKSHT
ncbi:MAG: Rieske (2Fe-2S) protein [Gammaproteobacteria bacterium]|nr:Rieske (2Fe-2S) protein [Gammaproteobacteria bacterium]